MATTVFLLRHAAHERLDRILRGRMVRYRTRRRRAAAGRCRYGTDALETSKAVYSSTLQRMQETAAHSGVSPIIRDGLTEIEYCAWTNRSFASLGSDPDWCHWKHARAAAHPSGGESVVEVRHRAAARITALCERHPDGCIAVVSHCDIIKAVLAPRLRLSLDPWSRSRFSQRPSASSWPGQAVAKLLSINRTGFE